ncbi:Site-specific DNA methylase (Dcm) [uncultured Mediterranean phage uvMED]|nr:Site-specific DNA methylase (Dcm) [uncultured Mediterranean phage uvMED]
MKVLDLFSGIGGFSVGLERAGFETVAFCEIEDYPRAVLRRHWPDVPIYRDIRQLTEEQLRADGIVPDVICGGYPCQPFSVAGRQRGQEDERHLWPEMYRLIRECRPRWVISENVSGHIKLGLDEVLASLEAEGYTVWTFIIPACAVNAPHKRDRLWIVAHADSEGQSDGSQHEQRLAVGNASSWGRSGFDGRRSGQEPENGCSQSSEGVVAYARHTGVHQQRKSRNVEPKSNQQGRVEQNGLSRRERRKKQNVADASASGLQGNVWQGQTGSEGQPGGHLAQRGWWEFEPNVGRVAHGVPARSHRIKGLGNAVVPQIPEIIGRTILEYEAINERI